jgi:hypothetical protein
MSATMRLRSALAAPLLAALLATPVCAISGPPVDAAVGAAGIFYKVQSGRFVDLFGADPALPPERQVLALDIVVPGQPAARWVVPGTEEADVESSPAVLWDEGISTLHLVWSRRVEGNQTYSQLLLRSLSPTGWSELIDLSGGSIAEKSALRLLETADEYTTTIGESVAVVSRRILHLVWIEIGSGTARAHYSPIVFVDGRYIGWNPVVALDDLVAAETASPVAPAESLRRAPALAPGRGDDRVVVGFVHSTLGRLGTVEIRVLPGEVGELADRARGSIIELGQTLFPDKVPALAEQARGSIIELATASFHPAVAGHVAEGTKSVLLAADPAQGLEGIAEEARGSIIELANQVLGSGLANDCSSEGSLLEVPPLVPQDGSDFSQLLQLRAAAVFGAPEIAGEPPTLLVSPDGTRALVGWIVGSRLEYRETLPDGFWSEIRSLDLAQVPFGDAFTALSSRIAGR